MAEILSIRSSSPYQKITPEIEKEEQRIKNILFLLLILIGVNGSELLEKEVQSSSSKVEALKANFEKRQQQIDQLNNRLKEINDLYDQLNESGRRLADLPESERQAYLEKSRELQDMFEDIQTEVQIKMKNASKVMQEIVVTSKMDIEPLKQVIEALKNMGVKLSDLFSSQWGNNIQLKR